MTRRRGVWRWSSPELTWLVELDRSPHAERYGLDLGIHVHGWGGADPVRPTDCRVLAHLENLPVSSELDRSDVLAALDLSTALPEDERAATLRVIAEALVAYIQGTGTEAELRARYRAGDLRSAFVHKEARAVLESA